VNIRSLTRGDGAVIGAAVLLLIASFLPYFTYKGISGENSVSAWDSALFPMLPTVHLAGLIAAGLFVAARFQPQGRKVLGLGLGQWGIAVAVFAAWSALWSTFSSLLPESGDNNASISLGAGAWLTLVFGIGLAAVAVLSQTVPAFEAPLLPEPRPPQPQPQGAAPYGYPGGPGGPQQSGYGYPGVGSVAPVFGGGQPQPQQQPQPQPQQYAANPAGAGQPGYPAAEFAAFWFAVPVTRPLYSEDGSSAPIAELNPGTWYLAVDQRGPALVAQTQDGRRGVLQDTSGIQRG
jgi:Family of unknown function (DUF5336)